MNKSLRVNSVKENDGNVRIEVDGVGEVTANKLILGEGYAHLIQPLKYD